MFHLEFTRRIISIKLQTVLFALGAHGTTFAHLPSLFSTTQSVRSLVVALYLVTLLMFRYGLKP
jgi:hypothetical protein